MYADSNGDPVRGGRTNRNGRGSPDGILFFCPSGGTGGNPGIRRYGGICFCYNYCLVLPGAAILRVPAGTAGKGAGKTVGGTVFGLAVFAGCVSRLEMVWLVSDLWNGLMAYPNLLAVMWLSGKVRFPGVIALDKRRGNEYTKDNKRE